MSRFFMPGISPEPGDALYLTGENARHALTVLRLKHGGSLTVCDGTGTDYVCSVESPGKAEVSLKVVRASENPREPAVKVHLFTSLIKADKLEYVVQKAVELGVYAIHPFQSENSVARIGSAEKSVRLLKIAESAAKQSGRGIIPSVERPVSFIDALSSVSRISPDAALVAYENSDIPLKERFNPAAEIRGVAVFIGPEGGFSHSELAAFERAGILRFSLGKRVLRAETAALAALACVMYELGE